MNKVFTLLFVIFFFCKLDAQWVNLPDTNFANYLKIYYPNCFNGLLLDTTCSDVLQATSIDFFSGYINNIEGIKYFKSLNYIDCSRNHLTSIPALPSSLQILKCNDNQITSILALTPQLNQLYLNNNQISTLPQLPSTLKRLSIANNNFSSLPILPNGLTHLNVDQNHITVFPYFTDSLQVLSTSYNPVNSIPTLPSTLNLLYCSGNNLTTLPKLPSGLWFIACDDNKIDSLPQLPDSLTELSCHQNNLTSIPKLPEKLTGLRCSNNRITALPQLNDNLMYLDCNSNMLTILPKFSLRLVELQCNNNLLNSLPSPFPSSLNGLDCSHNNIDSLPLLTDSIVIIDCSYNPNLTCLPKLPEMLTVLTMNHTAITCIPNIVKATDTVSLPLCTSASGCSFFLNTSGNVHADTSVNCSLDSLLPGRRLHNLKVKLTQSGVSDQTTYLSAIGEYGFTTSPLTNYEILIDTTATPLYVECPSSGSYSIYYSITDSTKNYLNFGVKCKGSDIGVKSIYSRFRNGFSNDVYITAGDILNLGCAEGSAVLETRISGPAKYIKPSNGSISPSLVNGNILTYTIPDITAIDPNTAFNIVVQTDSSATLGSVVCITSTIHAQNADYIASNDSLTGCFLVVNSFDPNEKFVYPTEVNQESAWLTYTVNFQNTGNDTAYNIVVRDTINNNLDIETFQFLASSHNQPLVLINKNIATFSFQSINLLDSNHNEPKSHGWLQYRLKTKANLPLNIIIPNTAYIYFDVNAPIKTNTASTQVKSPISDFNSDVIVYPNPSKDILNVKTKLLTPQFVSIVDGSGKKVFEMAYNSTIDISKLNSGFYIVELKTYDGIYRKRFIKQ